MSNNFNSLVATNSISSGTIVFSASDWTSDEKLGWHTLTVDVINELPESLKQQFLVYSYDVDFNRTTGTINHALATHGSNFVNHSCSPNLGFDISGNIVAIRDIQQEDELTIDYGTFVVNFDQDFICNCKSSNCRKVIKKDDWKQLINNKEIVFPKFIRDANEAS